MRTIWLLTATLLLFATIDLTSARHVEARVSCTHHFGCVEGKYARKPIAGMTCRNSTSKRPGRRYHFFCMAA
jgi:hypothetical protein